MKKITCLLLCVVGLTGCDNSAEMKRMREQMESLTTLVADQQYSHDILVKKLEDLTFYETLGDVAWVDKVRLTGPPKFKTEKTGNPFQDEFLDNELSFYCYVFIPKDARAEGKYPLIVFPHSGIHSMLTTGSSHIIRELMAQGYIVVSADYRGSTGYGKSFHQSIDYGGRENEDLLKSRDYMVENYSLVDSTRVGLLGWSHGGMITLMNLLQYPGKYQCGYAGVPVSDVTYRLEYKRPSYSDSFTAKHHIGKTPAEDPEEYRRRSPVTYASQLERPLMITTTENDNDVGYLEVKRMIDSLTYYNKSFEYKIYPPMPGAHAFDRIDSRESTDVRYLAYKFLEKHLQPPRPFADPAAMRKVSYRFN